jgi:hypothetical protein
MKAASIPTREAHGQRRHHLTQPLDLRHLLRVLLLEPAILFE